MDIQIRPVDKSNWLACTKLQVHEHQKDVFPVPVVYWIAESKVEPSFVPMAIYDDTLLVGFLVYGLDPEEGDYWLIALLIDQQYQGRGYARATMESFIRYMRTRHQCTKLILGHRPENTRAEKLYQSLGFEIIDQTENEVIRCLYLS